MSRWFRHYAGMMRDEKLVRVAIKSKQPIERVLWVWGAILESAAEIDDAGRFDVDGEEFAYFLRTDTADIDLVLAALADAGRVAEDRVVNWGERQFTSDRSATRQAAYRERKRGLRGRDDTKGDGEVTSPDRHADAPETEAETDIPDANASGRPAPTAADITKAVWDTGKTILKDAGHDDRQAGSIIGRFRKNYSDSQVLTVLSRCQTLQPSEPVEWITKALQLEAGETHGRLSARPGISPHAGRGERPNRCLDMLATAEAEIRAAEDPQFGVEARPALRAIGSG